MKEHRDTAGRGTKAGRSVRRFTLIELLVVLAIVGIMFALVIPAFKAMGQGVTGAARMVGGRLRYARQYAIAHRKRIAVLMPGLNQGQAKYRYTAFRICQVDNAGPANFVAWVSGTKWEFLPTGAVIAEADQDSGATNPPNDGTWTPVSGVPGFTGDCRAVIFKPTGAPAGGAQRYVTVVDGFASNGTVTIKNAKNYVDILVDQYTGRISYLNP